MAIFPLGPVHLHPKTDKWDYLRSPIMKKKSFLSWEVEVELALFSAFNFHFRTGWSNMNQIPTQTS